MLTVHFSNFRMVLLVNANLNVVCIDVFVGFAGGGFSRVSPMIFHNGHVRSRFVWLVMNGFCFQDAKNFSTDDSTFNEGNGVFRFFLPILGLPLSKWISK